MVVVAAKMMRAENKARKSSSADFVLEKLA
jgi:hypothetical protein